MSWTSKKIVVCKKPWEKSTGITGWFDIVLDVDDMEWIIAQTSTTMANLLTH